MCRSGGASRRRAWSCRDRRGRRSRRCGGRCGSRSTRSRGSGRRARSSGSPGSRGPCILAWIGALPRPSPSRLGQVMTVAAVILAASPESALADADGMPAVAGIADAAWSGGATPIIVVSFDPDGAVATALAGAPVTLAEPVPAERGPAAQMARGTEVALAEVVETDAVLLWPARMAWVGPETITSLIETHGTREGDLLRP